MSDLMTDLVGRTARESVNWEQLYPLNSHFFSSFQKAAATRFQWQNENVPRGHKLP
jgi:hypothetical protein